ncbi:unnamed protein product [Cyprideis torosa]|uniref:Uncharacterized protein n=1 Tax=Cyprideis torosa TaxID=163714 RepID=A0A7R8WZC0_9CRUS|nr:unnamed protein product [Cyprideis torosa]CAG0909906.1 unnamed protein product [Cyprideis torosa]
MNSESGEDGEIHDSPHNKTQPLDKVSSDDEQIVGLDIKPPQAKVPKRDKFRDPSSSKSRKEKETSGMKSRRERERSSGSG